MNNYGFHVQWSEPDIEYLATCPEFPGISALAPTPEGAMAELRIALEAAVETYKDEGWTLPSPRYSAQHSGQFRLRVPHSLHSLLSERAAEEGVSLNTLAVTYLANCIGAATAQSRAAQQCERALEDMKSLAESAATGWARDLPHLISASQWRPSEVNTKIPFGRLSAEAFISEALVAGGEKTWQPPASQSARMSLSKVLAA